MLKQQPVFICIGQAGCQVGSHVVKVVSSSQKSSPFISRDGFLPIIFADTDTKVLNCLNEFVHIKRLVKHVNVVSSRNDKSLGRNTLSSALCKDKLTQNIIDQVRDEVIQNRKEKVFVFVHGLIGSTGSWLTSLLMEKFTVMFPSIPILSMVILPFSSGESSFQYYNSMIAINNLNRYTTLSFLFSNDNLLLNITSKARPRPSMGDMNHLAALGICRLLSIALAPYSTQTNSQYTHKQRPSSFTKMATPNRTFFPRRHSYQEKVRSPTYFSRYECDLSTTESVTHLANKNTESLDIINEMLSKSKHKIYFVDIQAVNESRTYHDKLTLMKLVRRCSNHTASKEKIDNVYLFCQQDAAVNDSLLIECLSKRFQLVIGNYKVIKECSSYQTKPNPMVYAFCYQNTAVIEYMKNVASNVSLMLANKVFLHYYRKSKSKVNLEKELTVLKEYISRL